MLTYAMGEARKNLTELVGRVAYGGEKVKICCRTRPLAVLVSVEDAELLQAIEDREDIKAARAAMREKGKSIPLSEVKRRLA